MRRGWTLGLLLALVALLAPASASGHALLERSEPQQGAALEQSPPQIAFYFNEPVEAAFGALRLFDRAGDQVELGDTFRPGGGSEAIAAPVPALDDGTYTATYHVVSADSHPVSGGFVFTVGNPGPGSAKTVSELLDEGDAGPVTSVAFWADRWLNYIAVAVAVGGLFFLFFVWGNAEATSAGFRGRLRTLLVAAATLGLATSLLALPLQAAVAGGSSFWSGLDPDALDQVAGTRFGTYALLRAGAWLLLGALLVPGPAWRRLTGSWWPVAAGVPAGFLVVAPALSGHAATQDPQGLLLPADILHVAAMAVWFGGLVALVVAVPAATRELPGPADRAALLLGTLLRFSAVALVAVAVLAATGTIQAIVEVGRFGALLDTGFGRAVLIKAGLLSVLIALGASNRRRLIPALAGRLGEGPGAVGLALRRNLRLEVALIVVVLGVAAALVSYAPAADQQAGPASGEARIGPALLEYTVDPSAVGANQIHLYLFDPTDGTQFTGAKEVTLDLELPGKGIGPIEADLRRSGPGHYVASAVPFGVEGDWDLTVSMRTSRFHGERTELEVPIK